MDTYFWRAKRLQHLAMIALEKSYRCECNNMGTSAEHHFRRSYKLISLAADAWQKVASIPGEMEAS